MCTVGVVEGVHLLEGALVHGELLVRRAFVVAVVVDDDDEVAGHAQVDVEHVDAVAHDSAKPYGVEWG